jgi:hypothetical protein
MNTINVVLLSKPTNPTNKESYAMMRVMSEGLADERLRIVVQQKLRESLETQGMSGPERTEEWYQGEVDEATAFMRDQPLVRLDW